MTTVCLQDLGFFLTFRQGEQRGTAGAALTSSDRSGGQKIPSLLKSVSSSFPRSTPLSRSVQPKQIVRA